MPVSRELVQPALRCCFGVFVEEDETVHGWVGVREGFVDDGEVLGRKGGREMKEEV